MASSSGCSSTSITICGHGTITKLNDAVYELYKPPKGSIDLEIIFFHGFQSQDCQNAYVKTWMQADESACWLNSWLSEKFPQSRILSISYDSNTVVTDSTGKMDMYVVGENLAKCIIQLARVGQSCPVVLVGYCVGGLVLKEVCLRAEQLGNKLKAEGHGINSYDTFLHSMRGSFFYSTCQLGSFEEGASKIGGPLMKYYKLLSKDAARLNNDFSELRRRTNYGWKSWGAIGANEIEHSNTISRVCGRKRKRSLMVEEGSARNDMDEFLVLPGEDHASICKPRDQKSSSFQFLVKFVQGIHENEEFARQWRTSLQFPQVYISMPGRVQEVITLLELDKPEPSIMYLVGMGGIGKSTLAKEVMMKIRSQFDVFCFVKDVKSRLKQDNLHKLIAGSLYKGNWLKVQVPNGDEPSLWQALRGQKVLLIMDNVDSEEQISTLLRLDWVGRGSRLIITSRERPCKLAQSSVVHEVPFLSGEESKNLFLAHLYVETGREIGEKLIDDVVAKCDGLPLTLEVMGSCLCSERDEDIWRETLERLKAGESIKGKANDRLWAKLRVSFDRLAPREKGMFLDLAVFDRWEPNGFRYDLRIWGAVWIDSVKSGLKNLEDKFFIRIAPERGELHWFASSEDSIFVSMREQLRDMGRDICKTSRERIELFGRVLQIKDVNDLLAENKGVSDHSETLSGQFPTSALSRVPHPWHLIRQLRRLRLLRMSNIGLIGDGSQRFPLEITLLHMNTCWRAKCEGHSRLVESDDWPIRAEDVGVLKRMRVLILEECLYVRLPLNFHELSELRIIMISGEQLREFPINFGLLPSLQVLFLEGVGLSCIPNSFYHLSSLRSCRLRNCAALEHFPGLPVPRPEISSNPLSTLTNLLLENLPGLEELPEALGLLGSLISMSIEGCSSLSSLPWNFGELRALVKLNMRGCYSLSTLPANFGHLGALQELNMVRCFSLSTLTENFGCLGALQELNMVRCSSLSTLPTLPENFGRLGALKKLDMAECSSLSILPENFGYLGALEWLYMNECSSLSTLPENFGCLGALELLVMVECSSLSTLSENFGCLGALQRLHITGCSSLSTLPENFGELRALVQLYMSRCSSLSTLPENFGCLRTLESLHMGECSSLSTLLENFGFLGALGWLESLHMREFSSLSTLPENFGFLGALGWI